MAPEALTDVLELARILRPSWAGISERIPGWHPRCEGESGSESGGEEETGSGEEEGAGAGSGAGAEEEEETGSGEEEGAGAGSGAGDGTDWKRMARKHEREAKKARQQLDEASRKLKDREDADKSEQEKAIEQARDEARSETQYQFEKERRADRLEVATTRAAAKGITVGTGEKEKTIRFADPEDALVHLERAIRNGDVDEDEIFDDNGKVKTDALTDALKDLLTSKPHLAADTKPRREGSADGGKGGPAETESTVQSEIDAIRRHPDSERGSKGARAEKAA